MSALHDTFVCGHRRHDHATADPGDTRCLAVDHATHLQAMFDDRRHGRGMELRYCACLRFALSAARAGAAR